MNNNKILCVTSFNRELYYKYAFRFMKSYNLPFDLLIYSEDNLDFLKNIYTDIPNLNTLNIFECNPELKDVINFEKTNSDYIKKKKKELIKTLKKVKGYVFDCVRFSYKVFAVVHAGTSKIKNDYDYILWIDADVIFIKNFDIKLIKKLIKEKQMMSYLGRVNKHMESGFLIFNLNHKMIGKYFKCVKKLYTSNKIYNQIGWTDSYAYEIIMNKFEKKHKVLNNNITKKSKNRGNVLEDCILVEYIKHLKGALKNAVIFYNLEDLRENFSSLLEEIKISYNYLNNKDLNNLEDLKLDNIKIFNRESKEYLDINTDVWETNLDIEIDNIKFSNINFLI